MMVVACNTASASPDALRDHLDVRARRDEPEPALPRHAKRAHR